MRYKMIEKICGNCKFYKDEKIYYDDYENKGIISPDHCGNKYSKYFRWVIDERELHACNKWKRKNKVREKK